MLLPLPSVERSLPMSRKNTSSSRSPMELRQSFARLRMLSIGAIKSFLLTVIPCSSILS